MQNEHHLVTEHLRCVYHSDLKYWFFCATTAYSSKVFYILRVFVFFICYLYLRNFVIVFTSGLSWGFHCSHVVIVVFQILFIPNTCDTWHWWSVSECMDGQVIVLSIPMASFKTQATVSYQLSHSWLVSLPVREPSVISINTTNSSENHPLLVIVSLPLPG